MTREQLHERGFSEIAPGVWGKSGGNLLLPTGLHSSDEQPVKGRTLDRPVPRETPGRPRLKICFRIFAVRPADWDGWHIKELQDILIRAGILAGDQWDLLQGEVISEKVHTEAEERTEIMILDQQPKEDGRSVVASASL